MKFVKKIILASLLVLGGYSSALSNERYIYLFRDIDGSDWYLDKFSIAHKSNMNVLTYDLKITTSEQARSYFTDLWPNHFKEKDIESYIVMQKTSYLLQTQVMNLSRKEFRNTVIRFYDKTGNYLKRIDLNENWTSTSISIGMDKIYRQVQMFNLEQNKTEISPTTIVFLFLGGGAVISLIIWGLIEFVSYIMTGSANPSSSERVTLEAEVIDAEFSDSQQDDYDYPYEDIGEALRDIK